MPINRFSRGYTPQPYQSTYVDQFIPLPVDAIGRSGQMLQEREDRAIEQLDLVEAAMSETGRAVADVDRGTFRGIGDQYRQRIEALPEDGVYFNKMRQIKSLGREFADVATPFLENSQAIKAATSAILENETLSSTDKERRIKALTGGYQGLALNEEGRVDRSTMFQGRSYADRVDLSEIADKAVSGIKAFAGESISIDPEGRLITQGGEVVSRDRVQAIAQSAIFNDPAAKAFLEDEIELAIRENPDSDPTEIQRQIIGSAVEQAIAKHAYNKSTIDVKGDPAASGGGDKVTPSGYAMTRMGKSMNTSIKRASDYDRLITEAREAGDESLAKNLEADRRFARDEFMDSPQFGSIAASMFGTKKADDLTAEQKQEAFEKWERFREVRDQTREEVDAQNLSSDYAPTRAQMARGPQDIEGKKRRSVQKQLQEEFGDDYQRLVKFDTEFNNFLDTGRTSTDFTITPATAKAINDMQSIFSDVSRPSEFEVVGSDEEAEELQENLAQYFGKMQIVDVSIGDSMRPENYVDVKYEDDEGNTREARLKYVAEPREGDLVDITLRQVGTPEAEALRRERNVFGRTLLSDEYQPVRRGSDISLALTRDRGVKAKVGSQELTGDMMWNRVKNRASDDQVVNLSRDLAMSADRHNILLTEIDIQKGLKGQLVGDKRKAYEELMSKPVVFDRRVDAFESAAYFRSEQ